ncbi:hypothetical protein TD95_004922 [Thielaviopsis punctulata]|uniref:EKC/KEOPS complex subunit GON7 n=1 Tax=Thielaviopsis punctulata TaxID=72032 RepID=A0A0F4ZEK7_9PEZI|nr:hypothetical protein TD95_004922 [Thielaviopsis punctulata]
MPDFTASYASPTNESFSLSHTLPSCPPSVAAAEKSAYLAALRQAITEMQDAINVQLTARMDEDNKTKSAAGGSGGVVVDDVAEEENYGEEVQEED